MLQYLLLLQVLFASEICSWSMGPELHHLRKEAHLEEFGDKLENNDNVTELGLFQFLNHFDQTDKRQWVQPLFVLNEYYRPGGPAFLVVSTSDLTYFPDPWIKYAKQFGAALFLLKHRYYGKSHPVENASTENLRYLSSQQALADAARLIGVINQSHMLQKGTKWIVFGGGYEGSLAVWLRLKYPHLVHGAVAYDAPLVAPAVDYPGFYKIVLDHFRNHSSECGDSIKGAFSAIAALLQNQTGQQQLSTLFNLCPSSSRFTINDKENLNKRLAGVLWVLVFINSVMKETIAKTCDVMVDQKRGTPLNRFSHVFNDSLYHGECLDYKYDGYRDFLQSTKWSSAGVYYGSRQSLYQSCNEFGLYPTQDYLSRVYGVSFLADFFNQLCVDAFGSPILYSGIINTYRTYGGTSPDVTNVVFIQGTGSPTFEAGVQKNVSSEAPAIIIEGAFTYAAMRRESPSDSPQLKAAREKVATYIETWLEN